MNSTKLAVVSNKEEAIKCSSCGSQERFILIKVSEPQKEIKMEKGQITEQQKQLAHILEAQRRFGE